MLGRVAHGIFWMYRYLERAENTARLLAAGQRMTLTRGKDMATQEWKSILTTLGLRQSYEAHHDDYDGAQVCDFVLRSKHNPENVMAMVESARTNARACRSALTAEVWEAVNEGWMTLRDLLARPVRESNLNTSLAAIRRESTLARGATHGSMLRNETYSFARLGTFLERADNTARILDVKYYLLLPSISQVGSTLDIKQWETILRSVSALRSYTWLHGATVNPRDIAQFLILHQQMPRSLAFCYNKICDNLGYLEKNYDNRTEACEMAEAIRKDYLGQSMDAIFEDGLHEFIEGFLRANGNLAKQISSDYSFEVTA